MVSFLLKAEMRARQLAAAEKRASENASRGIGDKAKVEQWQKRKQAAEEQEQKIQAAGGTAGENALRVRLSSLI